MRSRTWPFLLSVCVLVGAAVADAEPGFVQEVSVVLDATGGGEPLIEWVGERQAVSFPHMDGGLSRTDGEFWVRAPGGSWLELEGAGYGGDTDMLLMPDGRIVTIEMISDRENGTEWNLPVTVFDENGHRLLAFEVSEEPWWDRPWLVQHPALGVLAFATGPRGTALWRLDVEAGTADGPYLTPSGSDFAGRPIVTTDGRLAFAVDRRIFLSEDGVNWTVEEVQANASPNSLQLARGSLFSVVAEDGAGRLHFVAASSSVYWSTRRDDGTWSPAIPISRVGSPAALPWVVGNVGPGVVAAFLEGRDTAVPLDPSSGALGTPTTIWDVVAVRMGPDGLERRVIFPGAHRGTICAEGAPGTLGGGCQPVYAVAGSPYHVQDRRLGDFISVDRDEAGNIAVAFTHVGMPAWTATAKNRILVATQVGGLPLAR